MSNSLLILPGSLEYEETLGRSLPPDWQQRAFKAYGAFTFVADSETGLLRVADPDETDEYVYGGEYEERLLAIEEEEELEVEFVYHY